MSSTKRKQIKPQKIFNSKKIDSISANNILQQQETSTNWRVITDLSSSSSSSPPSSTTTSMKESKHSIESQLNNNNNNNHNLSQLVNNDYFNHFLYQQAIADSATCMNPNLMQSIEKIILMNLTPYLFGMINNQQQHQQFETYSSAFSTVNQNNTETINNFKKKNDLLCSCGTSFDSFEILNQHLKQTNHKMIEVKSNQNDYIFNNNNNNSKNKINNSKHDHKSLFSSASSSVCLSPSQSPVTPTTIATTNKMVRGQEEWVKNSRDNNFISQILKCLECSASFDTLADLSLHMLNTNHFSKFHNNNNQLQNINNLTTITNNRTNKSNNESINHVSSQSSSSSSSNKQHYKRSEQQPQANLFNNTSNVGCRLKNSITNQSDLKCLICNKKFDNNNNNNNKSSSTELPPLVKLIQHLQNAHKVTNVCTNCGAIFNNTDDLQKHLLEESYHHYHNNIQNINSSLTNKNLKRNNNNNNNNSSNSNLNIHKKIKSTCETSSSSSPTTLTPPLALPVENDFINNLKLNLFLNKQNEYNSSKQTTSNSISPSSSSTSSSYSSSSNSSSPSFLISSGNNETNLSNFKDKIESHPLLALQMFVNNSNSTLTENKTKVKQQQQQQYQYSIPPPPPLMPNESVAAAAAAAAATAIHKLPAKKRPYIEESLSNEEEEEDGEGEGKNNNLFKLFKNNNNNNYKRSVEDLNNTLAKENKKCHSPLNLLQKMQIGLDDYLMR